MKAEFPALAQSVNGKPLRWLDNAATTQKPRAVIEAISRFYAEDNANVHRGVHALGERATQQFEAARGRVQRFLHAPRADEIIFLRGVTEAANLVAGSFLREGDEVVTTVLEHHSNFLPWQRRAVLDVDDAGELRLEQLNGLISPRTRLVAVAHVSNVLGVINPLKEIVEIAHARGVPVLVDGAQAAAHLPIDVQALGCDFYAFSGHKTFGPMGSGALWARHELLEEMPPWQRGGEMVQTVSLESAEWQKAPHKFEAGTPDVAAAVGLHAALDWLQGKRDPGLTRFLLESLRGIPGLRLLGDPRQRIPLFSFNLEGIHPHDVATILDGEGIAVRAGQMCAQPLLHRFGLKAAVRASLSLYNTRDDVEALVAALHKARETFA